MNIKATLGEHAVAVISTNCVFGPAHVLRPYTTVSLSKDGAPYLPVSSPQWVRFANAAGVVQEERGSDYNIHHAAELGDDAWYAFTYRAMPVEAITPIATVAIGDSVVVQSIHSGARVVGNVVNLMPGKYLVTDYPAQGEGDGKPGDSGSAVTTPDGVLVGFVSAKADLPGGTGSVIVIPNVKSLAGTTPQQVPDATQAPLPLPATPAPAPAPVPVSAPAEPSIAVRLDTAYANGRADAINQIRALINGLK